MAQPVPHLYVYPLNSQPGAAALLDNVPGTKLTNLYTIPFANNNAGLVVGQQYDLTVGPLTNRNPGSPATCNAVPVGGPGNYLFIA